MKIKTLLFALCMLPMTVNADILYRTEQIVSPAKNSPYGHDAEAFARMRRFYIGAAYNFSMWQDTNIDEIHLSGKNTSSFEIMAGWRPYDIFRLDANYIRSMAEWDAFKITGNTAMINAIFDARIDNIYRPFRRQRVVPYVGFGAGATWNSSNDVTFENKISPVASALAGIGVEMGDRFALDFGYRYMYMFSPKIQDATDMSPDAHQLRAGFRVNF